MSAITGVSRVSSEAAWAFLETAAQEPDEQVRDRADAILMFRE